MTTFDDLPDDVRGIIFYFLRLSGFLRNRDGELDIGWHLRQWLYRVRRRMGTLRPGFGQKRRRIR